MSSRTRVCMFVMNGFQHDTRVLKQAATLNAAGYEIRIIASLEPGTQPTENVHGLRVFRARRHIPLLAFVLRLLGATPPYSAGTGVETQDMPRTRLERFETAAVPERGPGAALRRFALRVYRRLSHVRFRWSALLLARNEAADVWIAHDLDTLQVADRARRLLGGGLVYDSHELFLERAMDPVLTALGRARWRRIEHRLIRRADRVTTVCPSIAGELAQRYGVSKPTVVMNAPVYERPPVERPNLLRSLAGLPEADRIALYVGGIQYSRPLHLLVEAARHLDESCGVVIIGPAVGNAAASLRALAAERGVEHKVAVLPPVPQEDVVTLAAGADVGLIPLSPSCLNHVYALPNKLFQYVMAGLPVVASPMVEISRFIEHYDVGAIFPTNEAAAIAETVTVLLADTRRLDRLRDNALRAALELSWESQAPGVLASVAEAHSLRCGPRGVLPAFRRFATSRAG